MDWKENIKQDGNPAVRSTVWLPPDWKMLARGIWSGPHNARVMYECHKWWLWQVGTAVKGPFKSKEEAAQIAA